MAVRQVEPVRKYDLDRAVAEDMGLPKQLISKITQAFLDAICAGLVNHRAVHLDRVGRLIVQKRRNGSKNLVNFNGEVMDEHVPDKIYVDFKKAPALKAMLQRHLQGEEPMTGNNSDEMEKYGVDEETAHDQERLEKQSAKGCPECGARLVKHGSVLLCPQHGSEPFEQGG